MEKVYRLLEWLTIDQAVSWLQDLTETRVDQWLLLQLCESGQCIAYMSCADIKGNSIDLLESVTKSAGKQKVLNPSALINCGSHNNITMELFGPAWVHDEIFDPCSPDALKELEWIGFADAWEVEVFFKSLDIQALASKMNGITTDTQGANTESEQIVRELRREIASKDETRRDNAKLIARLKDTVRELEESRSATESELSVLTFKHKQIETALEDAETRANAAERRAKKAEQDNKGSLLLTIAAMLDLLAQPSRGRNQSGVISEIQTSHPKRRGLSKRNLEDNFSAANTAAEKAAKEEN